MFCCLRFLLQLVFSAHGASCFSISGGLTTIGSRFGHSTTSIRLSSIGGCGSKRHRCSEKRGRASSSAKTDTGGRTRSSTLQARSVYIRNGKVCHTRSWSSRLLNEAGVRRGVNYTWAFMLLGQIVAISFATNLYFLTIILSPQQQQPTVTRSKESTGDSEIATRPWYRRWFGPWIIDFLTVTNTRTAALLLGKDEHQNEASWFMQLLLLPHIVLMVLPSLRAILPATFFSPGDTKTVNKIYGFLWLTNSYFLGDLLWTTYKAYQAGTLGDIGGALLIHPAVSSVGFDVIFCWVSWICWFQTQDDALPDFFN
jgi:hypothetical protein